MMVWQAFLVVEKYLVGLVDDYKVIFSNLTFKKEPTVVDNKVKI